MNELCAKRTTRYTRSPHLHTRPQQYVYIINNLHTSNCVPGIYGQQYWWGPMVHPHIVKTTCQAAISRKLANFSAMPIHLKMLRQKITWTRHDWEMGMVGNQQVCVCVCVFSLLSVEDLSVCSKTQLRPIFPATNHVKTNTLYCRLPAVTYRPYEFIMTAVLIGANQ